jgi:hypothetical protein
MAVGGPKAPTLAAELADTVTFVMPRAAILGPDGPEGSLWGSGEAAIDGGAQCV